MWNITVILLTMTVMWSFTSWFQSITIRWLRLQRQTAALQTEPQSERYKYWLQIVNKTLQFHVPSLLKPMHTNKTDKCCRRLCWLRIGSVVAMSKIAILMNHFHSLEQFQSKCLHFSQSNYNGNTPNNYYSVPEKQKTHKHQMSCADMRDSFRHSFATHFLESQRYFQVVRSNLLSTFTWQTICSYALYN